MKKILLIEDRAKRQQLFMNDTGIDLSIYSDILNNEIDKDYYKQILDDKIDLSQYDIIISHKSVGDKNSGKVIDKLKKHCKLAKTSLTLFSGGISANYYNDDNDFIEMEINSKTFYSTNLELFLKAVKENKENILMLPYGQKWKLNIILNILEKLNRFIEQYLDKESILYKKFTKEVDIEKIFMIDNKLNFLRKSKKVAIDDIKNLRDEIFVYISEQIDE